MKIQLVNTFLSFTTLFPFPRSITAITARITVRVGASALWVSRSLASVLHTATYLAIDVCNLSSHVISTQFV